VSRSIVQIRCSRSAALHSLIPSLSAARHCAAVCVNAVCAEPSAALGSLGCYLTVGAAAALGPTRLATIAAPFGPTFSKGAFGYLVGFIPCSVVTQSVYTYLCCPTTAGSVAAASGAKGQRTGAGGATSNRHAFGAAVVASGAGQLAVLACGTLWIGLQFRMGPRATLDAAFVPFLPGLTVKSLLCGAMAGLVTGISFRGVGSDSQI
jgi:biotin transporter BioY